MGVLDGLRNLLALEPYQSEMPEPPTRYRAIDSFTSYPGWTAQMLAVQGLHDRPWRSTSIREALGVPAIFRAVALIANTTGSLAVEAYRDGVKLADTDTPQLVKRPDPFRIPRDFWRDTANHLATRGEFWWWIAKRDFDDSPLSLYVVPPWEVKVELNQRDRLRPTIKWLDREMPRRDMRHGTFMLDENSQRGIGPLQLCGAAMSVAVESQDWAASFYNTGFPSHVIKAAGRLGEYAEGFETEDDEGEAIAHEASELRRQWMSGDHNSPRVIDEGIESVETLPVNEQGAQMLNARDYNNGDAARMFGIPGELLEYAASGSSLTYQNIAEVFTRFVKYPLAPDYLEPIEQHFSDLLPRGMVGRFNVKGFMRADSKTRWETYEIMTRVLGLEEAAGIAREAEGIVPGDIEYAPVPFAPPRAFPDELPVQPRSAEPVRCDGTRSLRGLLKPCNKLLAEQPPFIGTCPRCHKEYRAVEAVA